MQPSLLSPSRRLRRTPFSEGVEAAGVKAYTIYNHMLLPTIFRSVQEDYHHLKTAVQVWDVACERQVELNGPDATRLMRRLTPRNLEKMQEDQCCYVPIVDENGGMLNDPVAIRHSEDRWWISIADSDLLYVLSTFVFEPIRWLQRYGRRPMTAHEQLAWFNYYRGLGERMKIAGIPEDLDDFRRFNERYEADNFRFAESNKTVATATSDLLLGFYLPSCLLWAGRTPRPSGR